MDYLSSDLHLKRLVEAFEAGVLKNGEWHHGEHLAICYWYLTHLSLLETIFRMKLGILKYNEKYAIEQTLERGYHETITLFFIKYVSKHLELNRIDGQALVDGLNAFISANKEFLPIIWKFYSKPKLNSLEARIQWVEPDLQSL